MRTLVWWFLLIATTAGMVWVNATRGDTPPLEQIGVPEGNPGLPILARYSLGSKSLTPFAAGSTQLSGQLMERIDAEAQTRADRIRVVAMAAEFVGVEDVRARIEKLRAEGLTLAEAEDVEALETIYLDEPALVTDEGRQRLVRRHGWFARLALTHGRPDDPARRTVEREALRTMIALLALSMGGLAATVAGVVLLVLAIIKWRKGTLTAAFAPPPRQTGDTVWLEPVVVLLAVVLLGFLLERLGAPAATGFLILAITIVLPCWPLARGVDRPDWRKQIGYTRGRGVVREFGAGLVGYLAGLPVFLLGVLITVILVTVTKTTVSHPGMDDLRGGAFGTVILYLTACLWAPWVEEMIFRGAFYRYLRGARSTLFSALVVGFFFAAVHPQGWVTIPALMSLGAILCVLRQWRGSIIAPMAAHAAHNFVLVTVLVLVAS